MDSSRLMITPSEILSLWNVYLTETMTLYVTKGLLLKSEVEEISEMLKLAMRISEEGVRVSSDLLHKANYPLPKGFSEKDVNYEAPKVYSDDLILLIKNKLAQDGTVVSAMSLGNSSTPVVRQFFEKQLKDTATLVSLCLELIQKRGLQHPIHIPHPNQAKMLKSPSFLGNLFFEDRPLSTAEIYNLVSNFYGTEILSVFFKSFARFELIHKQGLKDHFVRGAEIMDKHLDIFQSLLRKNDLPQLQTWESELYDSTISPMSERVILFKSVLMLSATAGRYGVALSTVMRKDVGVDFGRLMAEVLKYAEDTMTIMVKKGYLDQHPLSIQQ